MYERPTSRLKLSLFSFLAIFTLVLSACGAQGTPSPTSNNNANIAKGGTWIDDVPAAPDSMLPNGSDTTYSVLVQQAFYAPLIYGDADGRLHPGLLTQIPSVANGGASKDLKTWTFKLRPNLVWSDGQPLNADDVDFTWKLYNNPKFGAKFTAGFDAIDSATVSSDKLSITFHLNKAFSPFPTIWVDANPGSPLPKHRFESMAPDEVLKSPDAQKPTVVSGPFTLKADETTPDQVYTGVRNPKYYRASEGLPHLDKIVFQIRDDAETVLKDTQAGSITSSWFVDVSKIDAFKAATGYTYVPDRVPAGYEALWMNQNNPALKDVKVRTAIAMAINHKNMIDNARNGQANELCTDHPASLVPGYQKDAKCPKYDVEAAKKVLDDAGWKAGSDGIRVKDGVKLDFHYATTKLQWRKQDQILVQQDLKKIGINTQLDNYPGGTFFGQILPQGKPGQYDIGEFQQTYTYDADDSGTLNCKNIPSAANNYGGQNYSFWCSKDADKLFDQELATGDPNARQEIFNKLHDIYLTEFPFITEYAPIDGAVAKKTAHNYAPGSMGAAETVNLWDWWCDGGKC